MELRRPLSPRQGEALTLLAQGFTNADIATKMGVSENYAGSLLLQVYLRLGVENRVQAARWFWQQNPEAVA